MEGGMKDVGWMDGKHLLTEAMSHMPSAVHQLNPEAAGNVDAEPPVHPD